tara:strand:- start:1696 stop:2082 length:387 start_codon:yes stop_codon:yes gene_type:complete
VFFENYSEGFESLIAKSADYTNKPFKHSVVKINGFGEIESEDFDLTVNILCRDIDGRRFDIDDLELEVFKSNKELVFVVSKLNFPNDPMLWSGNKNLWMNSKTGKKCVPPYYSCKLENLTNKIRNLLI